MVDRRNAHCDGRNRACFYSRFHFFLSFFSERVAGLRLRFCCQQGQVQSCRGWRFSRTSTSFLLWYPRIIMSNKPTRAFSVFQHIKKKKKTRQDYFIHLDRQTISCEKKLVFHGMRSEQYLLCVECCDYEIQSQRPHGLQ